MYLHWDRRHLIRDVCLSFFLPSPIKQVEQPELISIPSQLGNKASTKVQPQMSSSFSSCSDSTLFSNSAKPHPRRSSSPETGFPFCKVITPQSIINAPTLWPSEPSAAGYKSHGLLYSLSGGLKGAQKSQNQFLYLVFWCSGEARSSASLGSFLEESCFSSILVNGYTGLCHLHLKIGWQMMRELW